MKKFLILLTALCLLCALSFSLAEEAGFRNVQFGMTVDEVIAAEGSARYERDTEHTRGAVTFDELEYEHLTDHEKYIVDIDYLFSEGKLVAARMEYDDDSRVTFDEIKTLLTGELGEPAGLDLAALGDGIYALDDDGRIGNSQASWTVGSALYVLFQEEDDVKLGWIDLSAAYLAK